MNVPLRIDPLGVDGLPNGYKRCEYLENKSSAYIDTGIYSSNDVGVQIKCQTIGNRNMCVWGASGDPYTSKRFWIIFHPSSGGVALGWATNSFAFDSTPYSGNILTLSANFKNNRQQVYNNNLLKNNLPNIPDYNVGIVLFAARGEVTGVVLNQTFLGRVYYAVITKGTDIVRNFIPALAPQDKDGNLTPEGTPCMYDTVSKKAFYNSGTGEFEYKILTPPLT